MGQDCTQFAVLILCHDSMNGQVGEDGVDLTKALTILFLTLLKGSNCFYGVGGGGFTPISIVCNPTYFKTLYCIYFRKKAATLISLL